MSDDQLAKDLEKVKVLCAMNETHQRFGPVEMEYKAGILADRDLLFICPDCENRVRIVFKSRDPEQTPKEAKDMPELIKEPEIVNCSCGETFDWENWDRKTWPMPKGIHEAVRHLDMGHTLKSPKKEAKG